MLEHKILMDFDTSAANLVFFRNLFLYLPLLLTTHNREPTIHLDMNSVWYGSSESCQMAALASLEVQSLSTLNTFDLNIVLCFSQLRSDVQIMVYLGVPEKFSVGRKFPEYLPHFVKIWRIFLDFLAMFRKIFWKLIGIPERQELFAGLCVRRPL